MHRRGLYQAIGERDSRLRRPTPIARAVERLMVLDAVLASADVTWLATEREKLTHFLLLLKSRLDREELPHLRFGAEASTTIRYFPDLFRAAWPSGARCPEARVPEPSGRLTLREVVTRPATHQRVLFCMEESWR